MIYSKWLDTHGYGNAFRTRNILMHVHFTEDEDSGYAPYDPITYYHWAKQVLVEPKKTRLNTRHKLFGMYEWPG